MAQPHIVSGPGLHVNPVGCPLQVVLVVASVMSQNAAAVKCAGPQLLGAVVALHTGGQISQSSDFPAHEQHEVEVSAPLSACSAAAQTSQCIVESCKVLLRSECSPTSGGHCRAMQLHCNALQASRCPDHRMATPLQAGWGCITQQLMTSADPPLSALNRHDAHLACVLFRWLCAWLPGLKGSRRPRALCQDQ